MANDPFAGLGEDLPSADQEFAMADSGGPRTNRRFLLIALLLVLIILITVGAILFFAFRQGQENAVLAQTAAFIETNNAQVNEALTRTSVALTWTKTPTPTATPTLTPTNSPTPTIDFTATVRAAFAQTATAEAFAQQTVMAEMTAQEGTRLALARTLTLQPAEQTGTASALQTLNAQRTVNAALTLTARAGGNVGTPTATVDIPTREGPGITPGGPTPTLGLIVIGTLSTPISLVTVVPGTGTPGIGAPTPTALPDTGFFEDIGLTGENPNSLPVIVLVALGLVGVIVIARRLRVRN